MKSLAICLLSILLVGAASAATRLPELAIEAPPELEAVATRLRDLDSQKLVGIVDLVGLREPGPPIRVILTPENAEAALATPAWVSGYAYGSLGVIVLFPERTPSYPDSSLPELLRHEVAHVLIARAAGGREVPRWFNEGLATLAADVWRLSDRSRFSLSILFRGESSITELDPRFQGDRREIVAAYALSSAFVRDVSLRYRAGALAEILSLVSIGVPFEQAFLRGTGRTLPQAEKSFWRRHSFWYRWFPVISSSITGWTFISLLFLVAAWRKRKRTAEIQKRWEDEERWLTELTPEERAASFEAPTQPN